MRMRKWVQIFVILVLLRGGVLGVELRHRFPLDETFQHENLRDIIGEREGLGRGLERGLSGVFGGAMRLSEDDLERMDFGSCEELLPEGAFTLSVWLRISDRGLDEGEYVLDWAEEIAGIVDSAGLSLKVAEDGVTVFASDGAHVLGPVSLNVFLVPETWQLLVVRYSLSSESGRVEDGNIAVSVLSLGKEHLASDDIASMTESTNHILGRPSSSGSFCVGGPSSGQGSPNDFLDGELDDFRIYSGWLSDEEVATLYNEAIGIGGGLRWLFNVEGDREGWSAVNTSTDYVANGDYVFVPETEDPYLQSRGNLNLDLTGVKKVFIRLLNTSSSTTGAVYFQTDAESSFVGNFIEFSLFTGDDRYRTYEVDMGVHPNWKGTLKKLRLDLPNRSDAIGSEIRVDRIAVGEAGNRPNVIVILADDLGWKDLTVNGSDYYETPNLDALAAKGINFVNAYSANPLCSPTRAAILTGLYPSRMRVNAPAGHLVGVELDPGIPASAASDLPMTSVGTRTRLPNGYVSYAEILKSNGYSTAFLGKWHLGRDEYVPENQGFDYVVGGRQHAGPPGGYFAPFARDANLPASWPDGSELRAGDHVNDFIAAWAADYIAQSRNKPFLMNLWWYDVHGPFETKTLTRSKYLNKSDSSGRQDSPTMAAMIEIMDDGAGVVLEKLETLGLSDDTIIFFTSDNGGWMYTWLEEDEAVPTDNYPARAGKGCIWDGGTRVPFIVRWPEIENGLVREANVSNLDIYATLLDMLELSSYDGYPLDSVSLVPTLMGQAPANENIVYNVNFQGPAATGTIPGVWVRRGDFKLIRFPHGNGSPNDHRYELYNLADDPGEERNLASEESEILAALDELIDAHLMDTNCLVPGFNPAYTRPDFAGWTLNDGLRVFRESNGILKIVSNSFLPALDSPDLSTLKQPTMARVRMASRSFGPARLWWRLPMDSDWSLSRSKEFDVIHDNVLRTYEVPLPLLDGLSQIRFQPSSGYFETALESFELLDDSGTVIHVLSFLDSDGDGLSDAQEEALGRDPNNASDFAFEFSHDGDTQGWESRNAEATTVESGRYSAQSSSADSQLFNLNLGFDANRVPELWVKIRMVTSGVVQFFWGHSQADAFSANRRLELNYTGSGDWQYLRFPLATAAPSGSWSGRTIKRLRLDPINIAGANWEIDWIRAPSTLVGSSGLRDSDGDGAADFLELALGLNPDDAASKLTDTISTSLHGGLLANDFTFSVRSGIEYRVWHSPNLSAVSWSLFRSFVADADSTFRLSHTTPDASAFFKIEVIQD